MIDAEYIIENADTFDWDTFECDMNYYSQDFADQFKSEIKNHAWKNERKEFHREDGPALIFANGTKHWYLNGIHHREGGPAIEWCDGDQEWYRHGKRHREGGPAINDSDGTKYWYLYGKSHREDGPSMECTDGYKEWNINGEELTEKEFNDR